jgi:virginiamycin B lyase
MTDMHMDHGTMAMDHCDMPMGGPVVEFILHWPGAPEMEMEGTCCTMGGGSTHELVWDRAHGGKVFWVSGQMYDHIARIDMRGEATYFPMDKGSAPHGMCYDADGHLWVTYEGHGALARINPDGSIAERIDVSIHAEGAPKPLNTRPHGLGLGPDGSLWFTGKLTNTVGRVDPSRKVTHYALPMIGAVPIYISAGPDGNMWCTELTGNMIARIPPDGMVKEFAIPTPNSRPIAIVRAPDGKSMWFSQEAGGKVARIDPDGTITEYPVPLTQSNAILAGLAFDQKGALWVQQYVSPPAGGLEPTANDYIVRLGAGLHKAPPGDLTGVDVTYFKAPSKGTVMHRITQGPDGNIWFSELGLNRVGRVNL